MNNVTALSKSFCIGCCVLVASVTQGADVAGLKQAPMSSVDLNSYQLSAENCQPLMDTADYGRATLFKLVSDLAEPLHIFSVTNWSSQVQKNCTTGPRLLNFCDQRHFACFHYTKI